MKSQIISQEDFYLNAITGAIPNYYLIFVVHAFLKKLNVQRIFSLLCLKIRHRNESREYNKMLSILMLYFCGITLWFDVHRLL